MEIPVVYYENLLMITVRYVKLFNKREVFIASQEKDCKGSKQDIFIVKIQEGKDFRLSNATEYLLSSGYNLLNFLLLNMTQ